MYTDSETIGQASERELERIEAEAGERPAAGTLTDLGTPWLGILGLALFFAVLYRGKPSVAARRAGKAEW